jgi:hypothetical protein
VWFSVDYDRPVIYRLARGQLHALRFELEIAGHRGRALVVVYLMVLAAPLAAILFLLFCYPTSLVRWIVLVGGFSWLLVVLNWIDH